VAANLAEGAFRLVFAVDEITEDLKRAVEYLNAHTSTSLEVVVLEFRYSRVDGIEILLPNSFGEEAARRKHSARGATPRWTEATFFEAWRSRLRPGAALLRRIFDWATPRVSYFYWGEGSKPSCTFVFEAPRGDPAVSEDEHQLGWANPSPSRVRRSRLLAASARCPCITSPRAGCVRSAELRDAVEDSRW
jgi:hypothetical protein